jgi:DNA-binding transcriptional ArsR family regulator
MHPTNLRNVRAFVHPAIEDVPLEAILHALANPIRVALLAQIVAQSCSQNCSMLLEALDFPIPKSTLSQHMKVLREAGLVRGERRGVEIHNLSRCHEVDTVYPGLIGAIVSAHEAQLAAEKRKSKRNQRRS